MGFGLIGQFEIKDHHVFLLLLLYQLFFSFVQIGVRLLPQPLLDVAEIFAWSEHNRHRISDHIIYLEVLYLEVVLGVVDGVVLMDQHRLLQLSFDTVD